MKKKVVVQASDFEAKARTIVSLAFSICEAQIKTANGNITPELKAMTAAMLLLEKAVETFVAVERISK